MAFVKALSIIAACLTLGLEVVAKPLQERQLAFDYNNSKVRGVNLGGWFVLEPFITPSLFQQWANGGGAVDEFTYSATLGKKEAARRLNSHWDTWITEADFKEIAAVGLNHVRIPVGYWAFNSLPEDPYVQGQIPYLDRAIGWARSAGLKVIIDVHTAPGSQNGFDNSGRAGAINWQQGDNVAQLLIAIQNIANRYSSQNDVVTGIELLNEPANWASDMSAVKKFYYDGWGNIRTQGDTAVVIHDAFLEPTSWNGFMNIQAGVNNVILDTHIYQIFSQEEVARKPCEHVQVACQSAGRITPTDKWTIVGEWTAAQTDCAKWLNGLGKGARYDATLPASSSGYYGSCETKYEGTVEGMLQVDKTNLQYFVEAQLDAYESHTGWFFWTWKTESAPEWHFQNLTRAGLIPQPLTARRVPSQCGTNTCMVPGN